MTFRDKMWLIASTVNGQCEGLLFPSWKPELMPLIETALNEQASKIGYDGWTWDRPFSEYGNIPTFLFWQTIRPVVLSYLNRHHSEAWFKPMYMSQQAKEKFLQS